MTLSEFNETDRQTAVETVRPALDIQRWIEEIVDGRPYESTDDALAAARDAANPFTDAEVDQALSHHPKLGERAAGESKEADLSRNEQAGLGESTEDIKAELARGNAEYEERFGQVFLIRAAGRSLPEILSELQRRLQNTPEDERTEVADQLRQIALLRIEGILS